MKAGNILPAPIMLNRTVCPDDRTFREVLVGDASIEAEFEIARHLTECDRCGARMHAILSHEPTRLAIQKRGEERPLWQFVADSSKLTCAQKQSSSSATVRRDDGVEATLHLPRKASAPPPKDAPIAKEADAPAMPAPDLPPSIYSFLSPPEAPGELGRLGGYAMIKLLGVGGMGMVFQAEDPQLKRKIALKVMRPEVAVIANAHDRFLREARTMASIEHDHVIAVYQVGEERGVPFLAMPLLQGATLEAMLKQKKAISLATALRIGFQVANGLRAAHEQGLIHRDIKPTNIWIETENNNRVKLLDFGLARSHDEEMELTQSGALLGTPAYMAPEQAAGGSIDARADLFSLGVVLYELTTGRRPFAGCGTMAILTALAIHQPAPPRDVKPSVPAAVSEFIMRLLEKDPAQRMGSARQAGRELAGLIRARNADAKRAPAAHDSGVLTPGI